MLSGLTSRALLSLLDFVLGLSFVRQKTTVAAENRSM